MVITENILIDISYKITEIIMEKTDNINVLNDKNRYYPSVAISNTNLIGYFKNNPLYPNRFDLQYRKDHGVMIKPGKFFKYILPDVSDKDLKQMVSDYKAFVNNFNLNDNGILTIEDDIKHWYNEDQYINDCGGSLDGSCMKHDNTNSYMDFYENYNISLLVLKHSNDKISGRALIWHDVRFEGYGKKDFMDRIYTSNENDEQRFINYAIEHEMVYKECQSYDYKRDFMFNGCEFCETIIIESRYSFDVEDMQYPYLDTLTFMDVDSFSLCNQSGYCGHDTDLDSTNGEIELNISRCSECGDRVSDDECFYTPDGDMLCECCFDSSYSYCNHCNEVTHNDDITECEGDYYCNDCRDSLFYECDDCGEWTNKNDCIYIAEDSKVICDSCYDSGGYQYCECCYEHFSETTEINGEYYCNDCRNDKYTECETCGKWVEYDEVKIKNDTSFCQDCYEEEIEKEQAIKENEVIAC